MKLRPLSDSACVFCGSKYSKSNICREHNKLVIAHYMEHGFEQVNVDSTNIGENVLKFCSTWLVIKNNISVYCYNGSKSFEFNLKLDSINSLEHFLSKIALYNVYL